MRDWTVGLADDLDGRQRTVNGICGEVGIVPQDEHDPLSVSTNSLT